MESWKRPIAFEKLKAKLSELSGQAFEDFFHGLMERCDPSYFPVRAEGNLGDQGADGLAITGRKLFACYGPQTVDKSRVREKFREDLARALECRSGKFDTFVFVHTDQRGVSPTVAEEITKAQEQYPKLTFEHVGRQSIRRSLLRLDEEDIEDLIGQLPVREVTTRVTLEELMPLLKHLAQHREQTQQPAEISVPTSRKLDYNAFSPDIRDMLLTAEKYVYLVEKYYAGRNDPLERDEVAAAFRGEYLDLAEQYENVDDIVDQLESYILGTSRRSHRVQVDARVVLMYFFGQCEIFEIPPEGWQPGTDDGGQC